MEKQIKIGVDSVEHTLKSFIDTWKRIENGEKVKAEQRLYFENFETLFKTLKNKGEKKLIQIDGKL